MNAAASPSLPTGPHLAGNAIVAQSGGPTAVINQSLVGCVEELQKITGIERIFGARHAVSGMVADTSGTEAPSTASRPNCRWARER